MRIIGWVAAALTTAAMLAPAAAEPIAKEVFGALSAPAGAAPAAIGSYARGCLAGAVRLPADGPGWQAMRLSRNRHWGHPALTDFVERLAATLAAAGHPGLLVGDMAQPRGGPMRTGHASHQSGLDVDLWFEPMPAERLDATARETISAVSLLRPGTRRLDPDRFDEFAALGVVRTAARDPAVARIFVHPAIKQAFCARAGADRAWLRKVRPWWGHHYHFHGRLACPTDSPGCADQTPPPAGDGCDAPLAWWFTDEPWRPSGTEPKPPLRLADLPAACRALATAPQSPFLSLPKDGMRPPDM
mgnify:CR=1 FL=1